MSDLEFRLLTEEEAHILETTSHNPPALTDTFTAEDFDQEWSSVRDRLASRLDIFGEPWTVENENGDFMLSESGCDRWIYVTLCSTRLWRPEFVTAVAELLRHTPQDYRIACLTELGKTSDPEFKEPLVYLVISAHTVAGQAVHPRLGADSTVITTPANEALTRFGFPPSLFSNGTTNIV